MQVNIDAAQKLLPGSSLVISLPQKSPGVSCFEFWHLIHRLSWLTMVKVNFLLLCTNFLYSYKLGLWRLMWDLGTAKKKSMSTV